MKLGRRLVGLVLGLVAMTATSTAQPLLTGPRAVVQLRIDIDGEKEALATGVLVHRTDGPEGVVLYFLTSESPLHPSPGARSAGELDGEGGHSADEAALNIAVLRILLERSTMVPADVALIAPPEGTLFFVVTYTATGARIVVPQRVLRTSGRIATGDLEMPWSAGCVGAPAFNAHGVFGIVSACGKGQPPRIALLSAARDLLRRLIPGLDLGPGASQGVGIGN